MDYLTQQGNLKCRLSCGFESHRSCNSGRSEIGKLLQVQSYYLFTQLRKGKSSFGLMTAVLKTVDPKRVLGFETPLFRHSLPVHPERRARVITALRLLRGSS